MREIAYINYKYKCPLRSTTANKIFRLNCMQKAYF